MEIFNLQGDLVQAIVAKLAIKTFQHEQARAMRKRPQDMLAYDYLLRGYAYFYQRTRAANTSVSSTSSIPNRTSGLSEP